MSLQQGLFGEPRDGAPERRDLIPAPERRKLSPSVMERAIGDVSTVIEPLGISVAVGAAVLQGLRPMKLTIAAAGAVRPEVDFQNAMGRIQTGIGDSEVANQPSQSRIN